MVLTEKNSRIRAVFIRRRKKRDHNKKIRPRRSKIR